jgi:hypothetical protein
MTRSMFRRVRQLLAKSPEKCVRCGQPFAHNVRTYGGVLDDEAVVVGECCVDRLSRIHTVGVYVHDRHGLYGEGSGLMDEGKPKSSEEVISAMIGLQKAIETVDAEIGEVDAVPKKAGVAAARMNLTDAPWKAADAEWFERHPDRTHHARAPMKGEAANLGLDSDPTPPEMELTILVRQVEPGRRLRSAFFKPTDLPLPDVEPLAHALMDLPCAPGSPMSRSSMRS